MKYQCAMKKLSKGENGKKCTMENCTLILQPPLTGVIAHAPLHTLHALLIQRHFALQAGCPLTLVVFTLFPEEQLHPFRSGRTLHSSPSRHGCMWHHHFCSTIEATGDRKIESGFSIWVC